MEAMLGSTLLKKAGESMPTSELSADVVGIYFSAHWCPPCRGFTPKLAERYNELKAAGKSFEIVFASSDRDEASFNEYFAEQPWLAMPFADRKAKEALSKKFKVSGIPTFVLLNKDGSVITKDGREAVMETEYPFIPPPLDELLADTVEVVDAAGSAAETLADVRARTSHIGLYFSAHWCPPCKAFTPKLASIYKAVKASGKDFEIVFVSSDRDQASFDGYLGEMPWKALGYAAAKESGLKDKLSSYFKVQGIPSFVMLDSKDLSVVNANARGTVGGDAKGANFPWAPALIDNLDENPDGINDVPTVLALFEEAPDSWDGTKAAMTEVAGEVRAADKAKGEDQGVIFKFCEEIGGLGSKVRGMCKLSDPEDDKVEFVILDCSEGGFYVPPQGVDCGTATGLRQFVDDFRADKLAMTGF